MNRTLLLALALAPLALSPALAADRKPARTATVDPRLEAEFKASDTNKDGVLTRAEVAGRIGHMAAAGKRLPADEAKRLTDLWFARADANRDGRITPYEMQKLFLATARRYDANGDGVVSVSEREAARAAALAEAKAKPGATR